MTTLRIVLRGNIPVEVREPRRDEFPATLGGAVEYTLAHLIFSILKIMGEGLGTFGAGVLVGFLEALRPELVDWFSPLIDEIVQHPETPEWLRKMLKQIQEQPGEAMAWLAGSVGSTAVGSVMGNVLGVLLAPLSYALARAIRPTRPTFREAWLMWKRGAIKKEQFEIWAEELGYQKDAIDGFQAILEQRLPEAQLIEWMFRTGKAWEEIREELIRRGWNEKDVDRLGEIIAVLPPISDVIRFAVRDVYNEAVVRKYGYDEDLPEAFLREAAKRGLKEEDARAYWRAHWELPSVSQVFEMFHRLRPGRVPDDIVVDRDTMEEMLRIADIPAYWRRRLIAISYNPITRVDVRRMYRLGVIDRKEVEERYLDLGYAPEDAKALADFTVKYELTEGASLIDEVTDRTRRAIEGAYARGKIDRAKAMELLTKLKIPAELANALLDVADLERSFRVQPEQEEVAEREIAVGLVREGYRLGVISRDQARSLLLSLDYGPERADYILNVEDYRRRRQIVEEKIDLAVTKFVERIIDEDKFIAELHQLDLSAEEIDLIVERARIARAKRIKKLPEATLARLLRQGVITEEEYAEELRALGYQEKQIRWLLQSRIIPTS